MWFALTSVPSDGMTEDDNDTDNGNYDNTCDNSYHSNSSNSTNNGSIGNRPEEIIRNGFTNGHRYFVATSQQELENETNNFLSNNSTNNGSIATKRKPEQTIRNGFTNGHRYFVATSQQELENETNDYLSLSDENEELIYQVKSASCCDCHSVFSFDWRTFQLDHYLYCSTHRYRFDKVS